MQRVRIGELDVTLAGGTDRQGGGDGPMLVLLHGYGAPGEDLVPIARQLAVPSQVRFAFPAAPLSVEPNLPPEMSGRAWWQLDMVELQRAVMLGDYAALTTRVPAGLSEARSAVTDLLAALESEHRVAPEKLILGGFSQGAMLATDLALRAERPPAGLGILSGSLICRHEWLPLMKARAGMKVVQSHGRADPILAYQLAEELRDELIQAGVNVEFVPFAGGHGIPNGALDALTALVRSVTA